MTLYADTKHFAWMAIRATWEFRDAGTDAPLLEGRPWPELVKELEEWLRSRVGELRANGIQHILYHNPKAELWMVSELRRLAEREWPEASEHIATESMSTLNAIMQERAVRRVFEELMTEAWDLRTPEQVAQDAADNAAIADAAEKREAEYAVSHERDEDARA